MATLDTGQSFLTFTIAGGVHPRRRSQQLCHTHEHLFAAVGAEGQSKHIPIYTSILLGFAEYRYIN